MARGLHRTVVAVSAPQRFVSGSHPAAAGSKVEGATASSLGGMGGVAVKVVGVGTRGASALNKLVQHGKVGPTSPIALL